MCLHNIISFIKNHNEGGITLLFAQHHEQGNYILYFYFTCGVALTGYSLIGSSIENMEMVISSVEMHKLNAMDKELPIQLLEFKMKVCGLVLSVGLLLSSAPEFTRGGRMSF